MRAPGKALLLLVNLNRSLWLLRLGRRLHAAFGGRWGQLQDPAILRKHIPGWWRPDPSRTVSMTIVEGTRMVLELDDHVQFRTFMDGYFDLVPIALARRLCQGGLVYLDVGANVGTTSIPVANRGVATIAIEASTHILAKLYRNLALNPGATMQVFGYAVGEHDGEQVSLFRPLDGNLGATSTLAAWGGGHAGAVEKTTSYRVDTVLEFLGAGKVGLMKLDIEGAEAAALAGSQRLIAEQMPAVLFEWRPDIAAHAAGAIRPAHAMLPTHYLLFGVRLAAAQGASGNNLQLSPFDARQSYENVLAVTPRNLLHHGLLAAAGARIESWG